MQLKLVLFFILFGFLVNSFSLTKYAFLEPNEEQYELVLKSLEEKSDEADYEEIKFKMKTLQISFLASDMFLNHEKIELYRSDYKEPLQTIPFSPPEFNISYFS